MSAPSSAVVPNTTVAPPYPAALSILGGGWRSPLARDGRVALAQPTIQIGRMDGNDIALTDPLVSRYHAVIRWAPGGYEIEDLGSANGTYVQGQRIQGRLALAPGQTIRIGSTELHFNLLEPSQQAQAAAGQDAQGVPGSPPNPGGGAATVASAAPFPPVLPRQPELLPGAGIGVSRPMMPMPLPPGQAPGPQLAAAPHPYYAMMPPRREGTLARFIRTQAPKRYWRVFLLGLVAYFIVAQVLANTANLHLVPLAILIASALVPVVFVIFCWEQSAFADMPAAVVGLTFLSGAVLGLVIAAIVENALLQPSGAGNIDLGTAIIIGITEETAKIIAVVWFLRDRRLRSELDGLILGAAAGMGFAALETAGYGFVGFIGGFANAIQPGVTISFLIESGIASMNHALLVRMALAAFGHGVWTGIVCAVIWRERGQATFRLTPSVLTAFAIAVGLHALWDWSPLSNSIGANTDPVTTFVVVFGWFLLVGAAGLLVLRFLLRESLERAKLGPMAPPPLPFWQALIASFNRRPQQPVWQPYAWPQHAGKPPVSAGGAIPSMPPQPQPQPQPQRQPQAPSAPLQSPPVWPIAPPPQTGAAKPAYCPRCSLAYPPGTQTCPRCNGRLT